MVILRNHPCTHIFGRNPRGIQCGHENGVPVLMSNRFVHSRYSLRPDGSIYVGTRRQRMYLNPSFPGEGSGWCGLACEREAGIVWSAWKSVWLVGAESLSRRERQSAHTSIFCFREQEIAFVKIRMWLYSSYYY